jgi:hypothetical protein
MYGLKPVPFTIRAAFTARLKSCPDTERNFSADCKDHDDFAIFVYGLKSLPFIFGASFVFGGESEPGAQA